MTKHPEPTVSAVILNKSNQILLCKSVKWNNQYVIPGGHIEYGEKMEDALKREVLEETGLDIYDISLLSIQECINSNSFQEEKHFISIDYICRTDETEVNLNDEADSYIWADIDSLLELDLGGFVKDLFLEFLRGDSSNNQKTIFYNYVERHH